MWLTAVAVAVGHVPARFAGGNSADLASFLHSSCGKPAVVGAPRQFGPLTLQDPKKLVCFDFLADRLNARIVDQTLVAIADSALPYPHSRSYVPFLGGRQLDPRDKTLHEIENLELVDHNIRQKKVSVCTVQIKDLLTLKWNKKISSNWFIDDCYVSISIDSLSEEDFWKHVAASICAKAQVKGESIVLSVDYDALRERWCNMERATLTRERYWQLGPSCEVRYKIIQGLTTPTLRSLIEPKATSLALQSADVPVAQSLLASFVEARLNLLRKQASSGDEGAMSLLKLIQGSSPTVFVRSIDFIIVIGLPGPGRGFVMI